MVRAHNQTYSPIARQGVHAESKRLSLHLSYESLINRLFLSLIPPAVSTLRPHGTRV